MNKIARYTVLHSAIDGDILLLPVRVRHVETIQYDVLSPANNIQIYTYVSVFHSHSCPQR